MTRTTIAAMPGTCIRPEETETLWGLGERYHMRLGPAHTGGAFQLTEVMCLPGGGPPPHIHLHEDEAFYVLDGQMSFLLGDHLVDATAGQFVWAPRGQVHQFRVPGPNPARYLVWIGPGNLEAMFRQFSVPCAPDTMTPPPPDPGLPARAMQVAERYGIAFDFSASASVQDVIPPVPGSWVLGVYVRILAGGQQTDGKLCVAEVVIPPDAGPPPHFHLEAGETFHVVEGAVQMQMDERTFRAEAGTTVYIPPKVVHAFRGVGPGRARLLSIHDPAGMEDFFRACGVEGPLDPAPLAMPPEPADLLDMLHRYGMDVP